MEAAMNAFLEFLSREQGYANNTIAAYRNDLGQLLVFLGTEEALTEWSLVGREHISAFIVELESREYASSTVARKVAALKSFFHYLHDKRIIASDPTAKLESPKVQKRLPRSLSRNQIAQLLSAPPNDGTPKSLRDKALLTLLYATGMRVTEVVTLSVQDADLEKEQVKCQGHGDHPRFLPLIDEAKAALVEYLEHGRPHLVKTPDEEALFLNHRGERLTRQGLWLIIKVCAKQAGLPIDVTPHTLRHSFATHKLTQGSDLREVQRLLGHANVSTTHVYSQLISLSKQNAEND